MSGPLAPEEVRRFYDRFGARQDRQAWYEDPPVNAMLAAVDWSRVESVFELGCGTGRLAEELLERRLGPEARYFGVDLSGTMVELARERLLRFGERARVAQGDGLEMLGARTGSSAGVEAALKRAQEAERAGEKNAAPATFDLFISAYVLDILSNAEIKFLLKAVHRRLPVGGQFAAASLGTGTGLPSRIVARLWKAAWNVNPKWVGGCRPLALSDFFRAQDWASEVERIMSVRGMPSEFVVERKVSAGTGAW